MRKFDYQMALEWNAREVVAALPWCRRKMVCVNPQDQEVDWLKRTKEDTWKPLWKVLSYYPYTTWVWTDNDKETSEFNFKLDWDETKDLGQLLCDVWFGYVDMRYHKRDNKTALKLQNRLTKQIVYMGWYDGVFTVSEIPPKTDSKVFEINEQ